MHKKKCLLILPRSIFPLVCGYSLKNETLIKVLNHYYDLYLIVISDKQLTEKENEFYRTNSYAFYFYCFSKFRFLLNAIFSLFSFMPLQIGYYKFSIISRKVNELFKIVEITIGVLGRTVDYLKDAPENVICVFDMVDSIGLNYKHSKKNVTSLFWKLIYNIEADRLMKFEEKWVKKANVTFLFNKTESEYWSRVGRVKWLHHGVNAILFNYNKVDKKYTSSIAFIGKMDYQPNIDAIKWYIEHVHIKLPINIPLIVIGAFPTKEVLLLAKKFKNITITGYLDDPYCLLNSSMAVIAPMRTGGGIQNKVLESMALGKVNIISSLAAKPIIGGCDGKHYIIADDPQEYIDILVELKNTPEKFIEIGKQAKKLITSSFTWSVYENEYINEIESFDR